MERHGHGIVEGNPGSQQGRIGYYPSCIVSASQELCIPSGISLVVCGDIFLLDFTWKLSPVIGTKTVGLDCPWFG